LHIYVLYHFFVQDEPKINIKFFVLKKLEKRHLHAAKETEYLRLKRVKMSADDFEPLKVIGRGAFGEVTISLKKNPSFFSKLINFL